MTIKKYFPTIGEKFDRLTVMKEVEPIKRNTAVLVECECGNKFVVRYYCLRNGNTKSCGCLRDEKNVERNVASIGKKKKGYVKKSVEWWNHWSKES